MTEGVWIAIIGSVGVVAAAIITGVFGLTKKSEKDDKKKSEDKISINQKVKGSNNNVIGVQNIKKEK